MLYLHAGQGSGASTSTFDFVTGWSEVVTGLRYLRDRDSAPATTQFEEIKVVDDLAFEESVNLFSIKWDSKTK
ncbi:hypothetical protein QMG83_14295 [Salinibacterium sp. G-O1]|uniref:hypothetical protein n=1 Tax=Salinibacterium sp. G-O1 TaxID=3046208 RepID=UPI0024BA0EC9|nr:hypothetical protein [Salinibacterium sp. G-O1]MDJ0336396.1 hypothetical protein [Salinibacterium sp. G-O1]